MFFVAAESNQLMLYAASLGSFVVFICGSFGVFFFGFSSSSLRFSLFFVCDTTDRDDGDDDGDDDDGNDDVDKTLVDDRWIQSME